jgi:hypothetical protein
VTKAGGCFSVKPLDKEERLSVMASWRLRREKKAGRTGVLLVVEIREPVRSLTHKAGIVSLWEEGRELCARSRDAKSPKFVKLLPGFHVIEFKVIRMREEQSTSFVKTVDLRENDILVASCDPVQANVFYRRSPDVDSWTIGVV